MINYVQLYETLQLEMAALFQKVTETGPSLKQVLLRILMRAEALQLQCGYLSKSARQTSWQGFTMVQSPPRVFRGTWEKGDEALQLQCGYLSKSARQTSWQGFTMVQSPPRVFRGTWEKGIYFRGINAKF